MYDIFIKYFYQGLSCSLKKEHKEMLKRLAALYNVNVTLTVVKPFTLSLHILLSKYMPCNVSPVHANAHKTM